MTILNSGTRWPSLRHCCRRPSPYFTVIHGNTSQRAYNDFCANRTVQLYATFFELVGVMDFSEGSFHPIFTARVPAGGSEHEGPVEGMELEFLGNGAIRYEYKTNIIEECHNVIEGATHVVRFARGLH